MTDQPDALVLPEPIGPQIAMLDHPASRKILRWGRRTGKTRSALVAAIAGHGPGEYGAKMHPGILEGWDVVWLAQDYPNLLRVAWKEEVVPRLKHLPYCTLNQQDHTATITGLGTLHFASAEAIHGIRGMGKRVKGVIIDEAAWLDLETALQDVILPILLDNDGWLMLMSTTNAGSDGNTAKRIPSYFNVLCEQIRAGERGGRQWAEFYATAHDNPVISAAGLAELIEEYPADSPKLKQEVYAELLIAGEGQVLPHLDAQVHMIPRFAVPEHWHQWGAFDWGYNHPWVFGWYASDEDGNIVKVETLSGRGDQIEEIATKVGAKVPIAQLKGGIYAGRDIFGKHGQAIGYQGPTRAERLSRGFGWNLIPAAAGPNDRVTSLENLRAYTHVERDATGKVTKKPRFHFMATDGNRECLATLLRMQIDPKHPEDALKVDAIDGKGGDDMYDETRYGLMARPLKSKKPSLDGAPDKQPHRALKLQFGPEGLQAPPKAAKTLTELTDRLNDRGAASRNRRGPLGPSGTYRW